MRTPPVENTHFFQNSADLPSKTLTFLSRRCQIRSGSSQIRSETCILLRKCIHFASHTKVNLKHRLCPPAKRLKVLDGRSEDFKKKWAFSTGGTNIDVTTLNPISLVVRIYVYMHGFWNPISSVVCIYLYMHGFLKIYPNMHTKMHGFPTQNVCFRPDLGAA